MVLAQAAVLRRFGTAPEIETVEVDEPREGEVLVRTQACGVCHSDLNFARGTRRQTSLPSIMGHEAAGVIEAIGPGVTDVGIGDHVIACNAVGCGRCVPCLKGHRTICTRKRSWMRRDPDSGPRFASGGEVIHAFTDIGGFSEYLLVPAGSVLPIDPHIPFEHAALLGCAIITGVGAVLNTAQVPPGATVAVFGCGGIGSSIIQGARIAGASAIIAVDRVQGKLAQAERFGATQTIDATRDNPVEAIRDATDGGVDYAFEAVGATALAIQAFRSTAPRGTTVLVGAPTAEPLPIDPAELMAERRIMGSLMGSTHFTRDAPFYLELYRQGRLDLAGLVTQTASLTELPSAFDALEAGESMRTLITF